MSTIRLTGLSGIDTEQMIKDLMKAERTRVDKVEQDKQRLQWRQQLYNSINKDFANFILNTKKEFGLTGTSYTGNMYSKSLSSLTWVKKAISSNESVAKVSTTSGAINGSYEVKVHRLADGVKAASGANVDTDLNNILAGLNDGDTFEFKINEKTITIDKTDNMSSIVKKINSSDAGVQASYDSSIGRLFMQTNTTGENAVLNISAVSGSKGESFINALQLNVTSYSSDGTKLTKNLSIGTEYNGVDALVDFAGATGIKQPTNQFTINGISFDIKAEGTTTIKVDTDTDGVYDKIKGFVDQYNEIVEKMGRLVGEKQYRDFSPLTKEQKEAMSEKEIELWEEKAKSGLLRNDSIISSTMQKVRSSLYASVEGIEDDSINALYKIGISTEKWAAGSVGGKLEIDEEKLKKAISENVDGVLELLFKEAGPITQTDADGNTTTVQGTGGVITRMYGLMIDGMKEVINKAGTGDESSLFKSVSRNMLIEFVTVHGSISLLDEDVSDLNSRIDALNADLIRTEDRYYQKFATMEKLVQQMNNQSSWIAQQLGGM
ncbi:flagellar filament capping protein FliD [Brassicibacter mesophilus]|uniref:flagellar filament capping protein FliD n=1 Tax=Brassicibacter mesophilus TaxID=745119 RepID=UPI003D1EAF69